MAGLGPGLMASTYNGTAANGAANNLRDMTSLSAAEQLPGGIYLGGHRHERLRQPASDVRPRPECRGQLPSRGGFSYNTDGPEYFTVRWTGYFTRRVAGSYSLWSTSDDANAMWLDNVDTKAMGDDGSPTVTLSAGYHPVVIAFQEWGGGNWMWMDVQGPAGSGLESRQRLPNSVLFTGAPLSRGPLERPGHGQPGAGRRDHRGQRQYRQYFSGTITGDGRWPRWARAR